MGTLSSIDVTALREDPDVRRKHARDVAAAIDRACRHEGFLLVTGHGVDTGLRERLLAAARRFFDLPAERKATIAMSRGGRAWRGWFPLGAELTSNRPDRKEGLYIGEDLSAQDPRVRAGLPLHGPNLLPDDDVPELRTAVDEWLTAVTALGHLLVRAFGVGLGLSPDWFDEHLTEDPTILLRLFRYPAITAEEVGDGERADGVGEHTDYGLLTILAHDGGPGLQVRQGSEWIDVLAPPDAFVVNLGDMLERMTGGRYRSTPHRVRSVVAPAGAPDRISVPFFFDPAWDAEVVPLPLDDTPPTDDSATRWDHRSVHTWRGTYGEYLTSKVAKVFPDLGSDVLTPGRPDHRA